MSVFPHSVYHPKKKTMTLEFGKPSASMIDMICHNINDNTYNDYI